MTAFLAAFPMYDWPETRAFVDAEWQKLRMRLVQAGIEAPERLARSNADMPSVPGGIRDGEGTVIAPDPATLPGDAFDLHTLWRHPALLLAQTCWGPMEQGLARHVVVVGQPSYDGILGGQGAFYSSALVMRRGHGESRLADTSRSVAPPSGLPEGGVHAQPSRDASLPLNLLRGRRFAYNSPDSMSGVIALTRDLEAMGESIGIFRERIVSGGHRASIVAVAEGRADVAAVDCRSLDMARRYEPRAADVMVVGWTARRKGLPMITSRRTPPAIVAKLMEILARS